MNCVTVKKSAPGVFRVCIGSTKTGTQADINLPEQTLERLGIEIQKALKEGKKS